jgi:putative addiction module component (TIGR02574 family)
MTQITEQLLNQALQLSPSEREELAEQLYLSLDSSLDSQEVVDAAWDEEITQRIVDVDSGQVTLFTQGQVHDDIRKLLNREK